MKGLVECRRCNMMKSRLELVPRQEPYTTMCRLKRRAMPQYFELLPLYLRKDTGF